MLPPKDQNQKVIRIKLNRTESEALIKESLAEIAKYPIHQALIPQGLFANGFGTTLIVRKINEKEMIVGGFLLDVYCLGVRTAFLRAMQLDEYNSTIASLHKHENFGLAEPALVRSLVEKCAEYAKDLGFKPHSDYEEARYIFGDINAEECTETFTFGKNGKPHFVAGPNDAPKRCQRIVESLEKKYGPDGFTYVLRKSGK
jgi:hypothetical protein